MQFRTPLSRCLCIFALSRDQSEWVFTLQTVRLNGVFRVMACKEPRFLLMGLHTAHGRGRSQVSPPRKAAVPVEGCSPSTGDTTRCSCSFLPARRGGGARQGAACATIG